MNDLFLRYKELKKKLKAIPRGARGVQLHQTHQHALPALRNHAVARTQPPTCSCSAGLHVADMALLSQTTMAQAHALALTPMTTQQLPHSSRSSRSCSPSSSSSSSRSSQQHIPRYACGMPVCACCLTQHVHLQQSLHRRPPLLQADAHHQATSSQLSQEELEFISTLNEVGGSTC